MLVEFLIIAFVLVTLSFYLIYLPLRRGAEPISLTSDKTRNKFSDDLDFLFIFMPVENINLIKLGGMMVIGLLMYIIGYNLKAPGPYVLAFLGIGLGFYLPEIVIYVMKERRRKMFSLQVVDALVLLSNGLRSGFTMQQALKMLADEAPKPMAEEIELIMRENHMGVDINRCLMSSCVRTQDADWELAMTAVNIARSLGGNLAVIFDRIVQMVRERKILVGKAVAVTAQGRMQATVVGLLPVLFGFVLVKINPDMMTLMWTTIPGMLALILAGVLDLVGYFWVLKMSKIKY